LSFIFAKAVKPMKYSWDGFIKVAGSGIRYSGMIEQFLLSTVSTTVQIESVRLFGADPDRIGLLGKPPAAEHSFLSKSQ
jgi:hypothetical protein